MAVITELKLKEAEALEPWYELRLNLHTFEEYHIIHNDFVKEFAFTIIRT